MKTAFVCDECVTNFTRRHNLERHKNQSCKYRKKKYGIPIFNGSGFSTNSISDDNDNDTDNKINETESVITKTDSHSSNDSNNDETESVISETDSHSSENEEVPQEVKEECEKFLNNKDAWQFIVKEADNDYEGDVLEAFKAIVLFQRQLICNIPYQKVLMTLRRAMDNDDMDFEEALCYATKKREFLILNAAQEANEELVKGDDDEMEDGSGLFLSSHHER